MEDLEKELAELVALFLLRRKEGRGDDRRHDRIKDDEAFAMLKARDVYGLTELSIGHRFSRDPRSVETAIKRVTNGETSSKDSLNTERKKSARKRHVDALIRQVQIIRDCLKNPHVEDQLYFATLPLQYGPYDWRLDPELWLQLCTPDFEDEKLWGADFPSLRKHMAKSMFWKHLDELQEEASLLARSYRALAEELIPKLVAEQSVDESVKFENTWKALQSKRRFFTQFSRTPRFPQPKIDECEPYYSAGLCDRIMKYFYEIDPELARKQGKLEGMLQEINDDLRPSIIYPIIECGQCSGCSGSSLTGN